MSKSNKKKPIVAIVGRPNVGKSSLFNTLLGRKKSLVASTAGVTRDVVEAVYKDNALGYSLELLDTGGISHSVDHPFIEKTIEFAKVAIEKSDLLLFIVDAKEGITQDDQLLAEVLRKNKFDNTILIVNKVDNSKNELQAFEFYELGFSQVFFISCAHKIGIGDLREEIYNILHSKGFSLEDPSLNTHSSSTDEDAEETTSNNIETEDDGIIRCALLGKPNAGKSSFFNRIMRDDKAIVSDIPGTTRDVLTDVVHYRGKVYHFSDMAGLRRRTKIIAGGIEHDSIKKALWAIRKSDVMIMLIDSSLKEVTEQDKKLLDLALKEKKSVVIGLNKWDLIPQEEKPIIIDRFINQLYMVKHYPIIPFSTKQGKSILRILDVAAQVSANYHSKIKAKELTLFLKELIKEKPPFSKLGKLKILYGAQVSKKPPHFEIFVNNIEIITPAYKKYLMNSLYEKFPLQGVPLFLTFKNRH